MTHEQEIHLILDFFKEKAGGVFVDVGANHPVTLNQTWALEQKGWSGVLVEPNPEIFKLLCEQRPRSRAVLAAAGAESGEVDLFLGVTHLHSTLAPILGDPLSGQKVRVPLRTLDSILAEAGVTTIDFLSIDVEGHELKVLQGLNLEKYAPRLILGGGTSHDHSQYHHLRRHGYRLARRTNWNNWYVPAGSPVTVRTLNTPGEMFRLWRKMWLNPPFDKLKRQIKKHLRRQK